nr:hypothetical protein BaRGS_020369 [Batillaria attramentaria]
MQILSDNLSTHANQLSDLEKETGTQLKALTQQNAAQKAQIADLDVQCKTLTMKTKNHEGQLTDLDGQVTTITNHSESQDEQISHLDGRVSTLICQTSGHDEQLNSHTKQLAVQTSLLAKIQEEMETCTRSKVAFTAYSTFDQPASVDTPLLFNTPVINEGNGYDPNTGKFVAPADGVYAFFCSLKTTFLYPDVDLKLGDSTIVIFSSDDTLVGGAVKFLKSGEEVFLKPTGNLGALQGSPISPASTFWGFKIY